MLLTEANGKYMTWWNVQRINRKIKYTKLVEMLGMKRSNMSVICNYFIGKSMPSDDMIKKIADIFDVPFREAKAHFFDDWSGHNSKHPVEPFTADDIPDSASSSTEHRITPTNVKTTTLPDDKNKKAAVCDASAILSRLYGVVDYATYTLVQENLSDDTHKVHEFLYGKVPFDVYQKVTEALFSDK